MAKRRRTPPDLTARAHNIVNAVLTGPEEFVRAADTEGAGLTHQENAIMMSRVSGILLAAITVLKTNPRFDKEMRTALHMITGAHQDHTMQGGESSD